MNVFGNHSWWPVLPSNLVPMGIPTPVEFFQQPVVIFRTADNQLAALLDRCPHRGAPLSEGKIFGDIIQCPYHGWSFNALGVCTRVPGLTKPCPAKPVVKTFASIEQHGFIWLASHFLNQQTLNFSPVHTLDAQYFYQRVATSAQDILENFLDGFHTHFVHAGWIRTDRGRQTVRASRRCYADRVEITYTGENKQNGLFSALLEKNRGISIGRYLAPMGAEIEYQDKSGAISLIASLGISPANIDALNVCLRVATIKHPFLPPRLKRLVLGPLIRKVLIQDRDIVSKVSKNNRHLANLEIFKPLDTELDLMAPIIRQGLIGGELQEMGDVDIEVEL